MKLQAAQTRFTQQNTTTAQLAALLSPAIKTTPPTIFYANLAENKNNITNNNSNNNKSNKSNKSKTLATTSAAVCSLNSSRATSSATAAASPFCITTNKLISTPKPQAQVMEHSYMRDNARPNCETTTGLPAVRTILLRTRPQCPSCFTHPLDEHELDEGHQVPIPPYNEINAKEAMNECENLCKMVKNNNPDDLDWTNFIIRDGWSIAQRQLFDKVLHILDADQLARLSNIGRIAEPMFRRTMVDKSSARLRKVLASISWDARLTNWLHSLLMDKLPQSYMASYIDIMQSLNSKVPTLVDKMVFSRPLNNNQEQLAPILKPKWNPLIVSSVRALEPNTVILWISQPFNGELPTRLRNWMQQLSIMAKVLQIQVPATIAQNINLPLEQLASIIVALIRIKVQELRAENLQTNIILIGFNDGAAFALQAAMTEPLAAVICVSFAYNTLCGIRGTPDDRIMDIKAPILFVFGQNAARTSREEIEGLREKMQSKTEAVCVGSADDFLRVPKSRRKLDGVTQAVIDQAVLNEIYEFIKRMLEKPPGTRIPTAVTTNFNCRAASKTAETVVVQPQQTHATNAQPLQQSKAFVQISRKRKADTQADDTPGNKSKVINIGRTRKAPLGTNSSFNQKLISSAKHTYSGSAVASNSSNDLMMPEELTSVLNTILNDSNETDDSTVSSGGLTTSPEKPVTSFELVSQSSPPKTQGGSANKIKMIPSNQFLQIKPQQLQSESKIYTIKTGLQPNRSSLGIGSILNASNNSSSGASSSNTPTQYVIKTNSGSTQYISSSTTLPQQKFAVIKNANGTTSLQILPQTTTVLSRPASAAAAAAATQGNSSNNNMDISNIIDLPILMDDGDGNLSNLPINSEAATTSSNLFKTNNSGNNSTASGQLIISQKIVRDTNNSSVGNTSNTQKGGTFIVNPATQQKLVVINSKAIKPISIGGQSLAQIAKLQTTNSAAGVSTAVSNVKSLNLQALKANLGNASGASSSGNVINLVGKQFPQLKIINAATANSSSSVTPQLSTARTPLMLNTSGIKQLLPPQLKTHLLNRNITVKKYVLPASISGNNLTAASGTLNITTPTASIQSTPKIITLNPNFNAETGAVAKQQD